MAIQNVWWDRSTKEWIVRGKRWKRMVGRTSFDWAAIMSYHYSGKGNQVPGGAINIAKGWVEHNQRLFDREEVVLVVFNESAGWSPCPGSLPPCMFGQEPRDQGIWNIGQLRNLAARNQRVGPEHVTGLNKRVLEFAFQVSHETGCVFEWCIDATLKHTSGLNVGTIDHVIRQTAALMRKYQAKYPKAAFILRTRNEWNAHQEFPVSLKQVNDWAMRMYRWKIPNTKTTKVSFEQPGPDFVAEQWPEVFLIVDHGGQNSFDYDVGHEPGKYKMGNIHIERKGSWTSPVPQMPELRRDSRGQPVGSNENMYAVTKPGTLNVWYRNVNGRNAVFEDAGLREQMTFYENNVPLFDYWIVHDDIGKKANATWNPNTKFEASIAEYFGGNTGPSPPPPPPPSTDGLRLKAKHVDKPNRMAAFFYEHPPKLVIGGSEELVLKDSIEVDLQQAYRIVEVSTFHGLEQGDIVEMDTVIASATGMPLYFRSHHKEVPVAFNSWDAKAIPCTFVARKVWLNVVCRVTAKNVTLPQEAIDKHRDGNRLTANPHWGIWILCREI